MASNPPYIKLATLLGTWFGAGLSPKASGTMGSIAALPFAYVIQSQCGNMALFYASVAAFLIGWWASCVYLHTTDAKDPKEIVIDEVAGQWLLLSLMPMTWTSYFVGLVLFRFFDILKPWPISIADKKIIGGFGVMFDDILAALYPPVIVGILIILGMLTGHSFPLHELQQLLQ